MLHRYFLYLISSVHIYGLSTINPFLSSGAFYIQSPLFSEGAGAAFGTGGALSN